MIVHGIYHNFYLAMGEVNALAEEYSLSSGVKRYMADNGISGGDPWFDLREDRWEVQICNASKGKKGYICMRPYSLRCESYSNGERWHKWKT